MSAGGYCSDEAYLMNESYAFYTYTNTYRNPVFEDSQNDDFQDCSRPRLLQKWEEENKTSVAKSNDGERAKSCAGPSQSSSKLPLIGQTRQRWAEICDNLAFTTRDKLFVMELNFKRRLRSLRGFFTRKLPPLFAARAPTRSMEASGVVGRNTSASGDKSWTRRWPTTSTARRPVFVGANLGELLREERVQQQKQQQKQRGQARDGIGTKRRGEESGATRRLQQQQQRQALFNLSEPTSAEALSAQQERILNRLERIKRDNQKLSLASNLLAARHQFDGRPASSSNLDLASASLAFGDGQQQQQQQRQRQCFGREQSGEASPTRVGSTATRLPKSASSPGGQVAVPFWLVRSSGKDKNDDDDGEPALASSRNAAAAYDVTDTASATSGAASLTPSASSRTNASNLAETVKATTTTTATATRATVTKTASSRVTGSLSKCAKATSGFLSSVQGQTRRNSRSGGGGAGGLEPAEQKKTCIVCYERTPNIVTLPCEHSDVCSDCFIEIIYVAVKNSQYPLRCVLCRTKVERIRCSRRLMLSVNRSKWGGSKFGLLSF